MWQAGSFGLYRSRHPASGEVVRVTINNSRSRQLNTIEWVNGDFVGTNVVTSRVFRDSAITRHEFMHVTDCSREPCTTRFNRRAHLGLSL
jgi:hypothetical protein